MPGFRNFKERRFEIADLNGSAVSNRPFLEARLAGNAAESTLVV
jgi:hypothetical protein